MTKSVEEQAADAMEAEGSTAGPTLEGLDGIKEGSSTQVIEALKEDMAKDAASPRQVTVFPGSSQQRAPIEATTKGVLIGGTFEEQYRLARAYSASGLMPRALDTPEKVLVALQLCHELGLPPMTSVGKIMVLNGTPSIFGDLPLALVRKSGLLASFEEKWMKSESGEVIGAQCIASRKGEAIQVLREFSVSDAKLAKLWMKTSRDGKPTPWVYYPQRMLQLRARGWCLKDLFPDVLMGISIMEYEGEHDDPADNNQAPKLVERFK